MNHQQICEFVNSKDVRKYLKGIGYEFSTPQAAWLVHRCRGLTMEERHEAWREIIRDMPDCAVEERNNMKRIDSFHAFLNDYIEMEERGAQDFMSAADCVYCYEYYELGEPGGENWYSGGAYFSNYQHCIDHYKQWNGGDIDIGRVRIWKYCLVTPDSHRMGMTKLMILTPNLEILVPDTPVSCGTLDDYELARAFDGMCFDFPVPFSRGDILVNCTARDCGPFVLSHISTWNSEKMLSSGFAESDCPDFKGWEHFDKVVEKRLKIGDYTDGCAVGTIIADEDCENCRSYGSFGWDHFTQVTDLEYFRGSLEGIERQLEVLSCYEKGELKARDLVNLCCAIRMEATSQSGMWQYDDEFLEDFGMCRLEDW